MMSIQFRASFLFENHHMKTTTLPFIILVLLIAVAQAGAESYAVALRPSTLGI